MLLSAYIKDLRILLSGIMPARIEFTDEQLEEMTMMYQYGFSSYEIADWFGVSGPNVILRRLREKNVEIRPPAHLRDEPPRHIKRDIPVPWINADAAYVFGVLIGDASIQYAYKSGERNAPNSIALATPNQEFRKEFSKAAKSAFEIQGYEYPASTKGSVVVVVCSVDLGRSHDRFKWRTETWRIPEQFFDAPEEIKIALCQGKFDSDGTVDKNAIVTNCVHRQGLEDLQRVVESLGYKTTLNGPYEQKREDWQDAHKLRILNASTDLFGLPRKKKSLRKPN